MEEQDKMEKETKPGPLLVVCYLGIQKVVGQFYGNANELVEQFENSSIILHGVRALIEITQPIIDRVTGEPTSMQRAVNLLPLDFHSGPVNSMTVKPVGVVVPIDQDLKRLEDMVKGAEANEMATRAMASGLVMAGGIPAGHMKGGRQ
jgi:hypothetical protein